MVHLASLKPTMIHRAGFGFLLVAALWLLHRSKGGETGQSFGPPSPGVRDLARPPAANKIWQTWRTPLTQLHENDRRLVDSWLSLNPSYRHEWLSDLAATQYVKRAPIDEDIRQTFLQLRDPILRADLLRYILLYVEGGVYADMDTEARVPIDEWVTPEEPDPPALVVGIERHLAADEVQEPDVDSRFSLVQYVMRADAGHPVLESALRQASRRLRHMARVQKRSLADIQLSRLQVLQATGPTLWTQVVMDHLHRQTGWPVSPANFTGLNGPRRIHDVAMLPINYFASGQRHSRSGSNKDPGVLVVHHFRSSWTASHPIADQASQ